VSRAGQEWSRLGRNLRGLRRDSAISLMLKGAERYIAHAPPNLEAAHAFNRLLDAIGDLRKAELADLERDDP